MKIEGLIYLFAPLESDLKNRLKIREHLARPTVGRMFLKKNEEQTWSIPFISITHLISVLNEARSVESGLWFYHNYEVEDFNYENSMVKDIRRCLRVKLQDIDPECNPLKYASYLGKKRQAAINKQDFSADSIGMLTLPDSDIDYKYHKMYFTDFFDLGVKLDKIFSAEVCARIPVKEEMTDV